MDVRDALVPRLTEAGRQVLEGGQLDLPGQEKALRQLVRKAASGAKLSRARLADLSRRGLVTLARGVVRPRVAPQQVATAQALPGASPEAVSRAPRQAEVLAWLLARAAPVPVEEVVAAFPRARPQLRALVQRKLAKLDRMPAGPAPGERGPLGGAGRRPPPPPAGGAPREPAGGG